MSKYSGTKYPILAETRGPVEPYIVTVDLRTIDGVYLNYLIAESYLYNKSVCLVFDLALRPCTVEVTTVDDNKIKNWTLSDLNIEEFRNFAAIELQNEVDSTTSIEELARKVLVHINNRDSVKVLAYRKVGKQ